MRKAAGGPCGGRPGRIAVLLLAAALRPSPAAAEAPGGGTAITRAAICGDAVPAAECRIDQDEFDRAVRVWEERLRTHGHRLGRRFLETDRAILNAPPRAWYYDAERVFLQAGERLGDPDDRWNRYAQAAEAAYEAYLQPAYNVPGYERFPHGLALDHRRNDDPESLATLRALRDRGPFADVLTNPRAGRWYRQAYSREVAYMIDAHVMAERRGLERREAALARYVDMALRHIRAWTTGAYIADDPQWRFCQAFMAGLTASALIDYWRLTEARGAPDRRIPAAIQALADWLIERMWVPNHPAAAGERQRPRLYGSFRYITPPVAGVGGESPAPDLNMLIAPMYGWLYLHTGERHYRTVGDMAFIGGVALARLERARTFNQHYRDSFTWLRWRRAGRQRWQD